MLGHNGAAETSSTIWQGTWSDLSHDYPRRVIGSEFDDRLASSRDQRGVVTEFIFMVKHLCDLGSTYDHDAASEHG